MDWITVQFKHIYQTSTPKRTVNLFENSLSNQVTCNFIIFQVFFFFFFFPPLLILPCNFTISPQHPQHKLFFLLIGKHKHLWQLNSKSQGHEFFAVILWLQDLWKLYRIARARKHANLCPQNWELNYFRFHMQGLYSKSQQEKDSMCKHVTKVNTK